MEVLKEIKLDVARNSTIPVIVFAKQFDKDSRKIQITLYDGETVVIPPVDSTVTIRGQKHDGHFVEDECAFNPSTGVITAIFSDQMLAANGLCLCDIEILDNDGTVLSSAAFYLDVQKSPLGDQGESKTVFADLDKLKDVVDNLLVTKKYTTNLFDKSNANTLHGMYLKNRDGEIGEGANWFTSHYIQLNSNKVYSVAPRNATGLDSGTFKLKVCYYDDNFVPVDWYSVNGTPTSFVIENTSGYIRFSAELSKIESIMVCLADYSGGYVPFNDLEILGVKYQYINQDEEFSKLKNEITNNFSRKRLTIGNSDTIAILGDSATESSFAIKDKAFISKLSQFSNYQFLNYGESGKTLKDGVYRMQNNIKLYNGSFGYQDIQPKYTLLLCYVNDIRNMSEDEFGNSIRDAIDAVRMYGSEPILCTHFRMEHSFTENIYASVAKEKHVAFWDIYKMISQTLGTVNTSANYYRWYWGQGHPGTRTNNIFSDNLQYYLDKLEAPKQSLKIYRLRDDYTSGIDLDALRFDSQLERYNLFREISVGQRGILPEDVTPISSTKNIDDLSIITAQVKNIASEYDILRQSNQSINISTKCALISATLPYTDVDYLILSFDTSGASGLKVYVRDQIAEPKIDGILYMRFDMSDTSGITAGETTFTTEEDDGQGGSQNVNWIVKYVVENKCMYAYHGYPTGRAVNEADGGAGEITIGINKSYTQRVKTRYYYEFDRLVTGHFVELTADENGYVVPASRIKTVLNYDRADFLITSDTAFDISNINVEFEGTREKKCIRDDFVFESANGTNLIENPTFTTLDDWTAHGGAVSAEAEDECYVPGTSKVVDITNSKYLSTDLTFDGGEMGKKYIVDVYARYYPHKNTVAEPMITYDSLDYKQLCLQFNTGTGATAKTYSLYQTVSTAWKICRFEVIAPPGNNAVTMSILGVDDSPLQIAKVVCVEKVGEK